MDSIHFYNVIFLHSFKKHALVRVKNSSLDSMVALLYLIGAALVKGFLWVLGLIVVL